MTPVYIIIPLWCPEGKREGYTSAGFGPSATSFLHNRFVYIIIYLLTCISTPALLDFFAFGQTGEARTSQLVDQDQFVNAASPASGWHRNRGQRIG
jgi:hypothetical protein